MRYGKWKSLYKAMQKRERQEMGNMAIAFRISQYDNESWEKVIKTFY
jgi:hypothetical protein